MGPKENERAVEGAVVAGAAVEGAKENERAAEGVVVVGAIVEGAVGLVKKLGIAEVESADAVVGAVVVVGGCVVGWPNVCAAGTVCGADEAGDRLTAGAEGTGAGAVVDAVAGDFAASVLDGVELNENAGGAGFASVHGGAGAVDVAGGGGVNVMMGTVEALGPNSGAVALVETFDGVSAFFCSSILARILAIASASRSCFSHFENARNPGREGTSTTLVNGGACEFEEATRRPVGPCGKGCWKGFTRAEPLVND